MKYTAPRRLHWLLLISAVVIFLDRLTRPGSRCTFPWVARFR